MSENWTSLPHAIVKRDMLFGVKRPTQQEWKAYADKFLAAGWTYDAVDFLTQAGDNQTLRSLRDRLIPEGDVFLFLKIQRSLGIIDMDAAEQALLRQCSEKAEELGKNRYAMKGFEKLGDQARVEKIRALVSGDGDILAAAETEVFIPPTEETDGEEEE